MCVSNLCHNDARQMYIHTRPGYKCAAVRKGDRLGLYSVDSPGSVGYNFKQEVSIRIHTHTGTPYIADGSTVAFERLVYPYQFSVAAFIDTGEY